MVVASAEHCCNGLVSRSVPVGPGADWESYEAYCNACVQAWWFGVDLLRGMYVPGAMATALVLGWFLTRWVEVPGQILFRGDSSWQWIRLKHCCMCLPEWYPSCCAWECCCCVYVCCCGCCCKCFARLRGAGQEAEGSRPLLA